MLILTTGEQESTGFSFLLVQVRSEELGNAPPPLWFSFWENIFVTGDVGQELRGKKGITKEASHIRDKNTIFQHEFRCKKYIMCEE